MMFIIGSKLKGVIIENDNIQGVVLCDQMRSLDWKARKAVFVMHFGCYFRRCLGKI